MRHSPSKYSSAWYGGGGLMYLVSNKSNPVCIDAGERYQGHGPTHDLREGSIQRGVAAE